MECKVKLLIDLNCENRFSAFTIKRTDGEELDKLFLGKSFPGGTLSLRDGRDLLRLLIILETMSKNDKVGSNINFFIKH